MIGPLPTKRFKGDAVKRPLQFPRLKAVCRSPAMQSIAADALRHIGIACIVVVGYLALFAKDNSHAHRLLWISVLAVDAIVAVICSVDLQGGSK